MGLCLILTVQLKIHLNYLFVCVSGAELSQHLASLLVLITVSFPLCLNGSNSISSTGASQDVGNPLAE